MHSVEIPKIHGLINMINKRKYIYKIQLPFQPCNFKLKEKLRKNEN